MMYLKLLPLIFQEEVQSTYRGFEIPHCRKEVTLTAQIHER